jgi:hypothetical protein
MAVLSQQIVKETEASRAAQSREAARVWMVRIIFMLYWLLIFTGALRKWGIPQLQKPLFFIAVPFTLWLYGISLIKNRWPREAILLNYAYYLAWSALLLIPVQMIIGNYALRYIIIAGYGWLNYFFYIPLAFIIANEFDQDDVRRLLRQTLWIGIFSAPLVAFQFISSPNSVINSGDATNQANQFHQLASALGHIRPAGLFTSSLGLGLFLTTLTISVIYGWIVSSKNSISHRITLTLATISLISMLAFSGNRGAFAMCGLVVLTTAIAGIITRRKYLVMRAGLFPLIVISLAVVLWPIVLPSSYQTFIVRWDQAAQSSNFALGPFGRELYGLYGFVYYLNTPVTGYIIGIATNAAARLSWVHMPAAAFKWTGYGIWARESNFSANIVDLGLILGMGYIVLRLFIFVSLLVKVWKSTKIKRDPLALMLFSFAGYLIFMGQITVQGTVNGYTWIFLGVTLAASKFATTNRDGMVTFARSER